MLESSFLLVSFITVINPSNASTHNRCDSQLFYFCVMTLGKLLIHMCLCHHAV